MKIGKITFDGYNNYGNSLQNYALQEYLKRYSDIVDTIWHSPQERLNAFWKWGKKEEVKFLLNHKSFRNDVKSGIRAWELARRVRGMDFSQRYINIRYDIEKLEDVSDEYDYFVVGSDQVWNPKNPDLRTAFLKFCDSKKRISYAASIGTQNIPTELNSLFEDGFKTMHAISVRESRAVEIVKDISGIDATLLLDPVFTISESKWKDISIRPYWKSDRKYIFAYFLGDIPEIVLNIAKENNLELVKCFDVDSIDRYIMSPEEWLYLIGNADYVCTDSFHATAFSIIFNRSFLVFPRNDKEGKNRMISRIESILNTFNLQDRLLLDDKNVMEIISGKYNARDIIQKESVKSDEFISRALGVKRLEGST